MSLAGNDFQRIRNIVEDVVKPIQDEITSVRNGIKEIYDRLTALENLMMPDKQFGKLTLKQQILKINSDLVIAARQAGVSLPR